MLRKTGTLDVLESNRMCQPVYYVTCSHCGGERSATQHEIDNNKSCSQCQLRKELLQTQDLSSCLSKAN